MNGKDLQLRMLCNRSLDLTMGVPDGEGPRRIFRVTELLERLPPAEQDRLISAIAAAIADCLGQMPEAVWRPAVTDCLSRRGTCCCDRGLR